MIISGHQPNFLPYPGFFHKMRMSEVFVLGDSLQYVNKEWQNRNRVILNTRVEFITAPVQRRFPVALKDVSLADKFWFEKPLRKLSHEYSKDQIIRELEEIFLQNGVKLVDLNVALIEWVRKKLNIKTKMIYLSDLPIKGNVNASERIVQMMKLLNSRTYLSGIGGKIYLDEDLFRRNKIEIIWSDWKAKRERDTLSILQKFLEGNFNT